MNNNMNIPFITDKIKIDIFHLLYKNTNHKINGKASNGSLANSW